MKHVQQKIALINLLIELPMSSSRNYSAQSWHTDIGKSLFRAWKVTSRNMKDDHSAAKTILREKMNEFSDASCNRLEMSDSFWFRKISNQKIWSFQKKTSENLFIFYCVQCSVHNRNTFSFVNIHSWSLQYS